MTDWERIAGLMGEEHQDWMAERRNSYERQERLGFAFLVIVVLCIIGWSIWEVVR